MLLGSCGQLSEDLSALYDLPSRILVRLGFIACVITVIQIHPSRITLTVLEMIVLIKPFE